MNNIYSSAVLMVGLALVVTGCASRPHVPPLRTVLFPDVKLEPNEYIQSVEMNVAHGRIVSVNHILDDWDIEVYWDNPSLKGVSLQAGHFVSGLDSARKLDGFITIASEDSYFDINAKLHTESPSPPGREPRIIVLNRSQLILKPQVPK